MEKLITMAAFTIAKRRLKEGKSAGIVSFKLVGWGVGGGSE
jgi:hypothetical protein